MVKEKGGSRPLFLLHPAALRVLREGLMGACLLVTLSMCLAQADTAPQEVKPAEPKPAPPAPDRWLLMKELQGTWPGWLLDGHKVQVQGWVDSAFTASSDPHDQLPMGFNYRANEFHVQQGWVRIERPVDQSARAPTFGFRCDTLAG